MPAVLFCVKVDSGHTWPGPGWAGSCFPSWPGRWKESCSWTVVFDVCAWTVWTDVWAWTVWTGAGTVASYPPLFPEQETLLTEKHWDCFFCKKEIILLKRLKIQFRFLRDVLINVIVIVRLYHQSWEPRANFSRLRDSKKRETASAGFGTWPSSETAMPALTPTRTIVHCAVHAIALSDSSWGPFFLWRAVIKNWRDARLCLTCVSHRYLAVDPGVSHRAAVGAELTSPEGIKEG